jgi:maleylacetoacetate isomerase
MKLYGYFRSSASYRVRIALNLKGVDYVNAFVHLRRDEHMTEAYRDVNPQGFIPALEDDDGEILNQSLAIIEYLDETCPHPPLLPPHPADRARVRALAQVVASDIHPVNNLRVLRYLRRELARDEVTVERWYNHWLAEGFHTVEAMLANDERTGRFCHGDAPGLADICLIPQVVNAATYALDLSPYPTIQRIFDTCMGLDAFYKAHPARQPDSE